MESPQNSNSRKKRNILIAFLVNLSAFIKYLLYNIVQLVLGDTDIGHTKHI